MRLPKAAAVSAALAALAITGCSSYASTGGAAGTGASAGSSGQLVLGDPLAPTTYEAADMNWGNQSVYAQAVYDTLLRQAPDGTAVQPDLATSWTYNSGRTVLTLTLRQGVTFTDGTEFTAAVAAQNLLRFKNGTSPQRAKLAEMTDAKALNDTTLQIDLSQPDPAFLVYLAQAAGLEESPKAFGATDVATSPVGSGPYVLDAGQTVVGTSYVYTRNPHYWDAAAVRYGTLKINVYTDPTSEVNALRGGQLNAAVLIDNSTVPQVQAAGFTVHPNPLNMAGIMLFDRGGPVNKALGDVKVRQAINYAFDKQALLKTVGLGYGQLDGNIFRPGSAAYDPSLSDAYPYDPAKARALLAQAGYPNGFTLVMPTSSLFGTALPPLIEQQLGAVGIHVSFTNVGQNLLPDVLAGQYAASYFTLQEDPNPYQVIDFMLAPGATWNPFHYQNPAADALIQQARTGSTAQQAQALQKLNQYVVDQAWFAKWYTVDNDFVTDKNTSVTIEADNAYPNLWDIVPAS